MEESTVPGVIETISEGFATVSRKFWLVIIPVVLDLCYWLGPRFSIAPLMHDLSTLLKVPAGSPSEYVETINGLRALIQQSSNSLNLLGTLSSRLLGIPSLIGLERLASETIGVPSVIEIHSYQTLVGLLVLLELAGLLIGCIYLMLIAQQIRDERLDIRYLFRHIWIRWFRLSALMLLAVIISIVAALPFSIILSIAALLSQSIASLLMGLFWAILFWVGLYFFFVPKAILLSEAGIWESLWLSFQLVRLNFWSTIGLVIITYVIGAGLSLIFESLAGSPWLDLVSIIGNAFIGTGLATAAFIFYRDRYMARLESLEQTRSMKQG